MPRPGVSSLALCLVTVHVAAVVALFGLSEGGGDDLPTAHIIAHSHCDPGWLDTFEVRDLVSCTTDGIREPTLVAVCCQTYYDKDVRGILDGVTQALSDDPKKRFIWAEMYARVLSSTLVIY
jgi:hypothetical protein